MTIHSEIATVEIHIGVRPIPGDEAESGEAFFETLSLTEPGAIGLKLKPGDAGWIPARAVPRGGGQYISNNAQAGDEAVSFAEGNVVETLNLDLVASDPRDLKLRLSELQRFILQARLYATNQAFIQPVSLMVQCKSGGDFDYPHYARIYDIDIAQMGATYSTNDNMLVVRSVTLKLTREPYYRIGVPYGWPATAFTAWQAGTVFDNTNQSPFDYNNHQFQSGMINNRTEFSQAVDDFDYPSVSQNYFEIDGADIPGDVPALCTLTLDVDVVGNAFGADRFLIYKRTSPQVYQSRGSTASVAKISPVFSLPVCDAGGGTAVTDTLRGMQDGTSGLVQVKNFTTSGLITWLTSPQVKLNMIRGTHMVFCRAFYTVGDSGATLQLNIDQEGLSTFSTSPVTVPFLGANQTAFVYMGTVTIPLESRAKQAADGLGLQNFADGYWGAGSNRELQMQIVVTGPTGPNPLSLVDLIFVPIDEALVDIEFAGSVNGFGDHFFYDSTRYMTRGDDGHAVTLVTGALGHEAQANYLTTLKGNDLTLTPGVNNLVGAWMLLVGGGTVQRSDFRLGISIVPRSVGIGGWSQP